jgi:hypothetical protein
LKQELRLTDLKNKNKKLEHEDYLYKVKITGGFFVWFFGLLGFLCLISIPIGLIYYVFQKDQVMSLIGRFMH